ncbi:MAG: CpaD family pilus assembly protein [OCS116 cluster bacterium]|nr:CpaD family pilus assembly protein [OCS116 cluster bacterium]
MKHIDTNKMLKSLAIMAACFSLTACYQTVSPELASADLNQPQYKRNHPIVVKKGMAEIDLTLPRKSKGLSPNQTAVMAQFIIDYMDKGEGHFQIWRPKGHLNTRAVKSAHQKVRTILHEAAIPATAISYHDYDAFGSEDAPLGLKFSRYYASTRKCGTQLGDLGQNYKNENYKNFGCAYQNNIAKMISNPKDLLGPASMSGASAERRQVIWAKYIQGAPTGATRSADEKVSIGEVAQ